MKDGGAVQETDEQPGSLYSFVFYFFVFVFELAFVFFWYLRPDTLSPELCCFCCNGLISYMGMFIDFYY